MIASKRCPCPCGSWALLTTGKAVYPHRPDLWGKHFYKCECGRYVGTHPDGKPLGPPADEETRLERMKAHDLFDRLWQPGKDQQFPTRNAAYKWLAEALHRKTIHIGGMDAPGAKQVQEVARERLKQKIPA